MTRNVLIVDDAATVRLYHSSILRAAGYDVAEAVNGYEGLEAALSAGYSLLVVDVNMPRLDGFAMVEALRRDGPNRATPVLMVSTGDAEVEAPRGYAAGANLYVRKPLAAEELTRLAAAMTGAA